jgi:transposase
MIVHEFIGIDVSKEKFDVCLLKEVGCCLQKIFNNNELGFREFEKWLRSNSVNSWICIEATGHYSEILADFLASRNIQVSVVNPVQIRVC